MQRIALPRFVVFIRHLQLRRSGLGVPVAKLFQVDIAGIFHRTNEFFAGDSLAIVSIEIQIRALAKQLRAQQSVDHSNNFGTFLVHSRGVEVGNFNEGVRPYRVGHWPGVFGELHCTQKTDVFHPLDRARPHISRELGVPKHGKTLFQAELKPVSAGHPVARPVVKILVSDNSFYPLKTGISGRFWTGQNTGGIKDVEAFILHRPHVEIIDGDNIKNIQIVLTAEGFLIPEHGTFQ